MMDEHSMAIRDHLKLLLFYCQESALDAATPGQEAKDRYIRNSKILKDCAEAMVSACFGDAEVEKMYQDIYHDFPKSQLTRSRTEKLTKKPMSRIIAR